MSKGSRNRTKDLRAFRNGYDKAFGKSLTRSDGKINATKPAYTIEYEDVADEVIVNSGNHRLRLMPGGNIDIDEPIEIKPGETVIVPMKNTWRTSTDDTCFNCQYGEDHPLSDPCQRCDSFNHHEPE